MKKIIPILIVGSFVLSGLGAAATSNDISINNQYKNQLYTKTILIPPLIIENSESKYLNIHLKDTSSYLMKSGKPILPKIVRTFEIPFGARKINVNIMPKNIHEERIENKIQLSPPLIPLKAELNQITSNQNMFYENNELYPSSWYRYNIGCGLNTEFDRVTFVSVQIYPVRYSEYNNKLYSIDSVDLTISYENPELDLFPINSIYDMIVIAPSKFSNNLQEFINHKNKYGVNTTLITTEEIYENYTAFDKPEQIKYCIKDAIETYGIKYVLLFGGLNSLIWARPRDDNNQGSKDWHVPARYTNLFDNPKFPLNNESILHDPGVLCDLYYADIYEKYGNFSSWDTNKDGVYAAWGRPGYENDTDLDLIPDVYVGRLACRNNREVKNVVEKIINYEKERCDPSWFEKMIVISGDGFLDQQDLDIQWNTTGLPDGSYTLYAESMIPEGRSGSVDVINLTIDRTVETSISFNHDDHLRINSYPGDPIAEIVTISEGDVLGNTNFNYTPNEDQAYNNDFNPWANMSFYNGILHIRGKSYDPKPYGNLTNVHVWVENSHREIVFSDWRNNTEMYYEGEWTTGEKSLLGRGGALYYMPEGFEKRIIWTSNGELTGQSDVIKAWSEGSGFLFISGHGSPNVWADHYPGVPGNREYGSVDGLFVTQITPWPPFVRYPLFPMNKISNKDKPPVTVIGGCHNSQFNVSTINSILDILPYYFPWMGTKHMWTYGQPVPECFSWYLVKMKKRGSIATIGNTGLGYGMPGKPCTTGGGDAWISIEFFKQYGAEGKDILGEAHSQAITEYINNFDMNDFEAGHTKTVQQWALLGDPSLKIGGYTS